MDTREVFTLLGFEEEWEPTAACPAYVYDFGNLRLSAIECVNKSYKTVFLLTGVKSGPRSIGMIRSEMSLTVDSFEEGVALIAYIVGGDFEPARPTPWLSDGREWQSFLPWKRATLLREQLYAARPKCWVARDWFRVVRPRLYAMAKEAAEDDLAWLTFDREVLRFEAPHAAVIVPATGEAWPDRYAIKAVELNAVPKRFPADQLLIIVYEDTLEICRSRLRLVSQAGAGASDASPIHSLGEASLPVDPPPTAPWPEETPRR